VRYMLFDVLYLEGHSLMGQPYEERREMLESMGLEGPAWQVPSYHRRQGAALLDASARQGLEGVVAKRLDSRYAPGQRSSSWIKVKNKQRVNLVVGGWLPEKERADQLGALLVGYFDEQGGFRYAGRVGTGWNAKERARLQRLAPLARERSPRRPLRRAAPRGGDRVHRVDQRADTASSVL
jgi:bifunctional non-homologous end joining protein LigD